MRESPVEVLTGLAVLVVAAGFAAWGAGIVGIGRQAEDVALSASFRSIEGVERGSEVRMSGVRIGTVRDIALDPVTFRASAVIAVSGAVPIPEDSTAVISSEGLLGGSFVEIFPGGADAVLGTGDEIVDTQGAVSLLHLLIQYVGGGGEAG